MTPRLILLTALVLLCGPVWAAPAVRPAQSADHTAPIAFYVVKGPPGTCGPGCDSWIAAEGKIDMAAATRFRKFIKRIGDTHLPIYFNSPGGYLEQALAIGNTLRENRMTARVGRTVASECGFEAQDSDVCIKLKQSGRALHGEIWLRYAQCNSACPFLILGAVNREIAPEASLAVHSPRITFSFTNGVPTREIRTAALQQAQARADRMVSDYLRKMGADPGLLAAARSVPFEGLRILTRDEIARFGIDRRERAETPWIFENASRSVVDKTIVERDGDKQTFRTVQLRLICLDSERFQLDYQRPASASGMGSVALMNGTSRQNFFFPPRRAAGQEAWAALLGRAQLDSVAATGQFELSEGVLVNAGQVNAALFSGNLPTGDPVKPKWQFQPVRFSAEGFSAAFERLLATCPVRSVTPSVVAHDGGATAAAK